MEWVHVGMLFLAFFLALLNGFFVASEFAIVKVRPTQVEELAHGGGRRARVARGNIVGLDDYLSATQLGITIASLGLGWLGHPAVASIIRPLFAWLGAGSGVAADTVAAAMAFGFITYLHIVMGELVPRWIAIHRPLDVALWTALPLRLFYVIMYPAIRVLNRTATFILRTIGFGPAGELEHAHSPRELEMIVESSARHGFLNEQERELLENVLGFGRRYVREIMVPRPDMVCLFTSKSLNENLAIVRESSYTRFPLATADTDSIVGMVHVQDLFEVSRLPGETAKDGCGSGRTPRLSLESISRPVPYVPEVTTVDRLFRVFQRNRTHLAVVVDEYGGVAGLATLEDVLEELVGEIHDEFDVDEVSGIERRANGEAIVAGSLSVEEVAEAFQFDGSRSSMSTIGGYVLQLLGNVPKIGDFVTMGRYRVEVIRMDGHRVTHLRFRPTPEGGTATRSVTAPEARRTKPPEDAEEPDQAPISPPHPQPPKGQEDHKPTS
ncbi:hemolysin family protein [Planctomycetota bacterium]